MYMFYVALIWETPGGNALLKCNFRSLETVEKLLPGNPISYHKRRLIVGNL